MRIVPTSRAFVRLCPGLYPSKGAQHCSHSLTEHGARLGVEKREDSYGDLPDVRGRS